MHTISKALLWLTAAVACSTEDTSANGSPDGSADASGICPLSAPTCASSECTAIRGARLAAGCLEPTTVIGCYVSGSILITLDIACVKHIESGDLYQIDSGSSLADALAEHPDWGNCTPEERGEVVLAMACG